MYFRYFEIISAWNRAGPFIRTNLNPLHTQGLFVPSLFEIGLVVLFNFVNIFSLFLYYIPLGKGRALHLNKLEFPIPKDALYQVWLKLVQWFLRRRWKVYDNDNGLILIRKAHLNLWLRWAKNIRRHETTMVRWDTKCVWYAKKRPCHGIHCGETARSYKLWWLKPSSLLKHAWGHIAHMRNNSNK